ncbi:MAG TPA: DUF2950 family protein [Planctomycetota bacterium]|nr:DUF2950 family protein [Planctomycetota bacterium]
MKNVARVLIILAVLGAATWIWLWTRPKRTPAISPAACGRLKALAEAQEVYRRTDHDGDGIFEYAHALSGDNSLLELTAGKRDLNLIHTTLANAAIDEVKSAQPESGYYFRMLYGQGPNAGTGARPYIASGKVTGGYAYVAFPAQYGETGRMTFLISSDGIMYEKDLGPETAIIARLLTQFDPDESWRPLE